jgi:excisionase family DNA binding protein
MENTTEPGTDDRAALAVLVTIPQASRALGIGRTTVYALIAAGELEVVHIGRCTRVPVEAIREFVAKRRAAASASL